MKTQAIFLVLWFFVSAQFSTQAQVHPLTDAESLSPLVTAAAEARLVLLGESTHGTSEFYSWRDQLSRRLISEQNISFVAVEGDWAALLSVNDYVLGRDQESSSAVDILKSFDRWPQWMWANHEFADFVEWLKDWNADQPAEKQVGLYGLDVYGWARSFDMLQEYLETADEDLAQTIRDLHSGLAAYRNDGHGYARAAYNFEAYFAPEVQQAVEKLKAHLEALPEAEQRAAWTAKEHAHVVASAERHFRTMALGGAESWNARADHMKSAATRRLRSYGEDARGIFWAHNTHVGDARATSMSEVLQRNIGQMARQKYGPDQAFIVGFSTYQGEAIAGRAWDARPEAMPLVPASTESLDAFLYEQKQEPYFFLTQKVDWPQLREALGHRAVGVVFQPEHEARNYVPSVAAERYDAIIVLPKTSALRPL